MAIDDRTADILPFYYVCVGFSVLHLGLASVLFVRQRDKFPITGHNVALTVSIGVAVTGVIVADAVGGIVDADTCSVATAVLCVVAVVLVNLAATQGIRLWFEYSYAEERTQTIQAEVAGLSPRGWFARKRKHFEPMRLVGTAAALSAIEVAVCIGVIFSLEQNGFAADLQCTELLIILVISAFYIGMTMTFFIFIFWRFRNKRDGFGLKDTFKWWGILWFIFAPPILLIMIWEGVTDLAYYVDAIRVLFIFLAMQGIMLVTFDVPLYLSFVESGQRGMSAISQVDNNFAGDEDDDEEVAEVLDLARGIVPAHDAVELQSPPTGDTQQKADMSAAAEAPAVFSSGTLTLGLKDILLNPVYSPQMTSLTRHLIGEFNVEGLLFFLRVLNFQNFAKSHAHRPKTKQEESTAGDLDQPQSSFSAGSSSDDVVLSEKPSISTADEPDVKVAWKALQVYFEFLGNNAPAQINVGHRVAGRIFEELEEAIVDLRQLPANVSSDDFKLKRPINATVFDIAQENVFKMIERDPFVRWRKAIRERVEKTGVLAVENGVMDKHAV